MQDFQAKVLADPEALANKPYAYRNALGAALRMPLDSLNSPQYIAKVAVHFAPTQQSLASAGGSSPGKTSGKAGGSSDSESQTQVERLTA